MLYPLRETDVVVRIPADRHPYLEGLAGFAGGEFWQEGSSGIERQTI